MKTRNRLAIVATAIVIAMLLGAMPALAHGKSKHGGKLHRKAAKQHVCVIKGHHKGDFDGDGLKNLDEWRSRTNPRCADTDKDGINDGQEDPDNDGLVNVAEIKSKTNPLKADTDKDGVTDADEDPDADGLTNVQEAACGTNPRRADSDKDRVKDGDEDADCDGLSNSEEFAQGCDPRNPDSDGDGVKDGDEVAEEVVEEVIVEVRADGTVGTTDVKTPTEPGTAVAKVDWYDQALGRLGLMATADNCDYQVLVDDKTEFAWAAGVVADHTASASDLMEGATVTALDVTHTADGELLARKIVLIPSPYALVVPD